MRPSIGALSRLRKSSAAVQWTIMALVLSLVGLVLFGNLYDERKDTESRARERLLSQAKIVESITSVNMKAIDSVLEHLCKEQAGAPLAWPLLNRRLEALADALSGVRTLLVLDAQGIIRGSSRPELLGVDAGNREYFLSARRNPSASTLYVTPPFKTVLDLQVIALARMIPGPDGSFTGVVVAGLDPNFFKPLLESVLFAPGMWAALAHGDGPLFLIEPEHPGVVGMDLAKPGTFFTRHQQSGKDASVFTGTVYATGEKRMLAARTINPPGLNMSKPLFVAVTRDLDGIFASWRQGAYWETGAYLVAVVCSCAGMAFHLRRQRRNELALADSTRALEESGRFIRTVTDGIPGMVAYWDNDLRCAYANNAYQDWFGKSPADMKGIGLRDLLGEALYAKNEPYIQGVLRGEPQRFERALTRADGTPGYNLVRYIPDRDGDQVRGFIVLVAEVTELKTTQLELEEKVRQLDVLATTDHLTGIANRRHFLQRAGEELDRSVRYGLPLVFLMMDIDHFKLINDAHGHGTGDEVLKNLADAMRRTLRTTDIFGRLGGEEFGALLIQTGLDEAKVVAERLRKALQDICILSKAGSVCFTVSIGLAAFAGHGDEVESLMKRADLALYNAKDTGRNKVSCFGEF